MLRTFVKLKIPGLCSRTLSAGIGLRNKPLQWTPCYLQRYHASSAQNLTPKFRDMSKPWSEEELEDLRTRLKKMPTYKNGYVSTSDFPAIYRAMNYDLPQNQAEAIIKFADQTYGGKISLEDVIRYASTFYNPSLTARAHAINFDLDKDGFISAPEFEPILEILRVVYPNSKLPGKTFQDFVKEADSNNDGKVSIDECADWIANFTAS